ncbi:MAG: hypothetical protein AAFS08_18535, partial [Pseudomonadota bacterium]
DEVKVHINSSDRLRMWLRETSEASFAFSAMLRSQSQNSTLDPKTIVFANVNQQWRSKAREFSGVKSS